MQLEQSPFLSIIPDEKIQQTLGRMGQPVDAKLIPAIAREVCQRTSSAAVLDGSIGKIGTQYLLTLKAVNCESGKTLASTEAQASDENHVLNALGKVSVEIRNKLGESLSTIQKFDTPLEEATTPSLEALKAYNSGMQAVRTKGPGAATTVCEASRANRSISVRSRSTSCRTPRTFITSSCSVSRWRPPSWGSCCARRSGAP